MLLARNAHKLQELANELTRAHTITAVVLTADLSEAGAADHVARELAERGLAIDILANNAGFGTLGEFAHQSPREQEEMRHGRTPAHVPLLYLFQVQSPMLSNLSL